MEVDSGKQPKPRREEWSGESGEPASPFRPAWHWVTSQTQSSVEFCSFARAQLDTARERRATKHESPTSPLLWFSSMPNEGWVRAPELHSLFQVTLGFLEFHSLMVFPP